MKYIVLTGATSGIGKSILFSFARLGHYIICNTRDLPKSDTLKQQVISDTGNQNIYFIQADLSDLIQVKSFAQTISRQIPQLDVLINNAGVWEMSFKESAQGIEMNFAVNHLAGMLLALELEPLLEQSPGARVIQTSSGAHRRNIVDLEDPEWRNKPYDGVATYSQSKLFNILCARALNERWQEKDIYALTVHPGYVQSDLFKNMEARDLSGIPDASDGARSSIYAALDPSLNGKRNLYIFHESEDHNITAPAKDDNLAAEVWDLSMKYIMPYLTTRYEQAPVGQ